MAITDSASKSIGLLVGVALVGAIFVVGTALLRNRGPQEVVLPTKPYSEPESGLIFEAPNEWSVGSGTQNDLQVQGVRLSQIQSQRSSCSNFSKAGSQSLESALARQSDETVSLWTAQYPGLVTPRLISSSSGAQVLVGVDTCSPSLNQKLLTFRGQAYATGVEIRFVREIVASPSLSDADLKALAVALDAGTSTEYQTEFRQFQAVLASVR